LTDDLGSDGIPVISVKDYKMFFETVLLNNVEKLSQIRKIKFNKKEYSPQLIFNQKSSN
jgi:hypothetical protein